MPIAARKGSDYHSRLKEIDPTVITINEATKRTIRELHIGIVNLMPDAALKATEEQFTLPLHLASGGLQIIPHFIAVDGLERGSITTSKGLEDIGAYVKKEYESFEEVKKTGLDGLIVTGANVGNDFKNAPFFPELAQIIDWANSDEGPTSTIYSCKATQIYINHLYDEQIHPLNTKKWGVYRHQVTNENHPLTHGMDTYFNIPHSRWNEIREDQFEKHGMKVLVKSPDAGVHMATSPDGLRSIFWQGHPEYDTKDLLGEFQRDIGNSSSRIAANEHGVELPPLPENYFSPEGTKLVEEFKAAVKQGQHLDNDFRARIPAETYVQLTNNKTGYIPNTWSSSRRALLSNWVAAILDKTGEGRKEPFMKGVNQDDVFNLESLER